jgi:hypothetical protein
MEEDPNLGSEFVCFSCETQDETSGWVKLGYQFFGDGAICGATERSECAPSSASPTVQLRQYLAVHSCTAYISQPSRKAQIILTQPSRDMLVKCIL